jgi:hypothetical protein
MEKLARSWLIASAAVTSFGLAPRHATAGDLQLTVVVYDHAHLNAQTLAAAERTTSAIFERASVQVVWRERLAYAAERHDVLAPEDPATLVVKLQPESEATRYGVRAVCGGIGFDSGAIIFMRRFDATWLSHIMAHELGHMLLGPHAHSVTGIMRGILLPEDWVKAAQGTLGFTRSQNQQIRRWIAERTHRS